MKYTRMAEIGAIELKRKIKLPIEIGIEERKSTCQLIIEIPAQKYVIDEMSTYVDAVWNEGGYRKGKTMSDYIKREDALEQFDYYDLDEYLTPAIRGILMDIPSADVAPVVRCKDCKWYVRSMIKQDGTLDERYKPDWCDLYRKVREETYFCADGERKDDEIDRR